MALRYPTQVSTVILALMLLATMPVHAQERETRIPDGNPKPSATTATYGAWTVRCQQGKKSKICEMVQTLANRQGQVVAQVAIGRLPKVKTPRAVISVPMGVDLRVPPTLILGPKLAYEARFLVCAGRFCSAEMDLPRKFSNELISSKKISVNFKMSGKTAVVPVETKGIANAFRAAVSGTR